MTLPLKTKPGINGANVLSIPTEWDASWFRKFINNSLKGADVRNAVGVGGITVTGTIASPYATIGFNGAAAGIVTQIVAGTNITISPVGGTGIVTINATGAVTSIVAGTGITISPAGGTGNVTINSTATTSSVVGTANEIAVSTTAGVSTLSFSPNVVIPAPVSGSTLKVTGAGGATAPFDAEGGPYYVNNDGLPGLQINSSGSNYGIVGNVSPNLWALGTNTTINGAFTASLEWNATGNVTIPAPSGGTTLTLTPPASGTGLLINAGTAASSLVAEGAANAFCVEILGSTTASQSYGLQVRAGTNASDLAFEVNNAANTANYLVVRGDGAVDITGGVLTVAGVNIHQSGSFTGTLTGMAAATTGTFKWVSDGQMVTLYIPGGLTGTSNSTGMTLTGLPTAIQPAGAVAVACARVENSSSFETGWAVLAGASGTVTLSDLNGLGFTATGTKGLGAGWSITYPII